MNVMQILCGDDSPSDAPQMSVSLKIQRLADQAKLDGWAPGPSLCAYCLAPYDHKPRGQAEIERLYQALFITGPEARRCPFICDPCLEKCTYSGLLPDRVLPGSSNHSQGNLSMRLSSRG